MCAKYELRGHCCGVSSFHVVWVPGAQTQSTSSHNKQTIHLCKLLGLRAVGIFLMALVCGAQQKYSATFAGRVTRILYQGKWGASVGVGGGGLCECVVSVCNMQQGPSRSHVTPPDQTLKNILLASCSHQLQRALVWSPLSLSLTCPNLGLSLHGIN